MLMFLAFLMLAVWAIALAFKVTFGLIHLLLVAAVVLFVVGLVRGRYGGTRRTPV